MDWIWNAGSVIVATAALVIAWVRGGRAEKRAASADLRAKNAETRAERAENRAAAEEIRNRVRFQYDTHEIEPGLYEGDVRIHLLQVGTIMAENARFDPSDLLEWSVTADFVMSVPPGGRASIRMARNRFGELPSELHLWWDDGDDEREQVVPLPAELYRSAQEPR